MKEANPAIRTVGVSMDRAPVMYHSLKAGQPIDMEEEDTLADALVGNIGLDNRFTFRLIQEYVDDVVLVSEEEIAGAMALALEAHRLIVEGGAAVGIAALCHTSGAIGRPSRRRDQRGQCRSRIALRDPVEIPSGPRWS